MIGRESNNFDFLRLMFASFVILTHAYPLLGLENCDYLCQLTDGQLSFSEIGVKGFFIISGHLIFLSLVRSRSLLDYYWKRVLRLFPGLFFVLLLTIFLGFMVYEGETSYWMNSTMWTYIPNNLTLFRLQYSIDGVFGNNPYGTGINGSLWTIPYEFVMYIMLSCLFLIRKKTFVVSVIIIFLYIIFLALSQWSEDYSFILNSSLFIDLGTCFMGGVVMAVLGLGKFKWGKFVILFLATISFVFSIHLDFFNIVKYICLTIMVILFGQMSTPVLNKVSKKIGDPSYGIYIYGFPVQQTLVYFFDLSLLHFILLSLIVSFILGFLSWHLIESKVLQFKKIAYKWQIKHHKVLRNV